MESRSTMTMAVVGRVRAILQLAKSGGIHAVLGHTLEHGLDYMIIRPRYALKAFWARLLCMKLGPNARIDWTAKITGYERIAAGRNLFVGRYCHLKSSADCRAAGEPNLVIGRDVFFNDGVIIDANFQVVIGDNTLFGPACLVIDGNHRFNDLERTILEQGNEYHPVKIGNHCWIGGHVVILSGVTIGDRSVIAANSTVTRSIPPCSVAVGTPARVIRQISPR